MLQEQTRGGLQEDYIHLMTANVTVLSWKKTQQNQDPPEKHTDWTHVTPQLHSYILI